MQGESDMETQKVNLDKKGEHGMETQKMDLGKVAAITLIVAGSLWLIYGGFSYTRQTREANVGSLHISVDENRRVNVPVWVGIGTILVGGVLLIFRKKT